MPDDSIFLKLKAKLFDQILTRPEPLERKGRFLLVKRFDRRVFDFKFFFPAMTESSGSSNDTSTFDGGFENMLENFDYRMSAKGLNHYHAVRTLP